MTAPRLTLDASVVIAAGEANADVAELIRRAAGASRAIAALAHRRARRLDDRLYARNARPGGRDLAKALSLA